MLAMKISKWMRFRHEAPRFLFSTNLSQLGQRAVWAYKIGEQIKKAQPSKDYSDTLLRKILSLQIQGTPFKFSPQLKKESLKMFTEGIELDETCFTQTQIKFAKQQDSKFIFFPSYLVAPTIFQILAQTGYNQMIFGGHGIGKTISIILYCQLYIPLHKYFYQAKYDQNIKIQLQKLKKSNLISNVPKYFYWSISLSKLKSTSLQEIVFAQTTQMRPNHRQAIKEHINDPKQFKKKLGQFLSKTQIKTFCVIDQINMAASCMRQWNLQVQIRRWKNLNKTSQQFCDLLEKEVKQGQDENFSKLNNSAQQVQKKITQFKYYGWYCVYSSSINIQKSLLEDPPFDGKKRLTLKIQDHQQAIFNHDIHSQQYLNDPQGQNQFYNFVWFEIWRNLKKRQIQTQTIQNLSKYFEGKRHELKLKKYVRFLHIRQTVQQSLRLKALNPPSHQKLTAFVDYVLQEFTNICLQNVRNRINSFLSKGDQITRQVRKNFINTIFILSMLQEDQTIPLSFQKLKIEQITGYYSILRDYLKSHQQNHQFIPIQIHDGKIHFVYTASQFIDIARTDIISETSLSFINLLPKQSVFHPSAIGFLFQGMLIQALKVSKEVAFLKRGGYQSMKIYEIKQFMHFNVQNSKLETNLEGILKFAYQNPYQIILGLPIQIKNGSSQISYQSKLIDFLFVQYRGKYIVDTVDVSTAISGFLQKTNTLSSWLQAMPKASLPNIILEHTILAFSSQKNEIQRHFCSKNIQDRAVFSPIEEMQIINYVPTTQSANKVKQFIQFRNIISKIKNSKILDK